MEKDKYHMISLMCGIQKQKQMSKQQQNNQKANLQRQITDPWLPEGNRVGGRAKQVKGADHIVMSGSSTSAGEQDIVHIDVELSWCTPETYIVL